MNGRDNGQDINFYPRSPCGERRIIDIINNVVDDFYPRSPCGERPSIAGRITSNGTISIHALLAESDGPTASNVTTNCGFLSTLSLRRATLDRSSPLTSWAISIHALLAESDHYDNYNLHCVEISIHALLAESDSKSAQNSGALLRI